MKKFILGIIVVIAVGYILATPYLTVYQMKIAAENQDGEALSEHIDFPVLRQNLKDQLNARLAVCRTWVSGLFLQTIIQARSSRQGALAHKINIYMYSMGVLNPQQAPVTARQMPFCPVSGPLQVV